MSTPTPGSVLSVLPDGRWLFGTFTHHRRVRSDETKNLQFLGWATVVTSADPGSGTYGTSVVAAFLDGYTIRTVDALAADNWTLTALAPAH
ncbi:hypothetical protein [Phytohabitans kaempferiae]|uniref:Uncharacterized protein n=1 Tax=Phytohabitans kaempferiae TaxID=1620943 RepID=A0ABV6LV10_9ACTN